MAQPEHTITGAERTTSRAPWLVGGALCLAVGALGVWHPGDAGQPWCPLRSTTGLDCPLCGGLRAVGDLAVGDLAGAADQNLLVALALPALGLLWLLRSAARRRRRSVQPLASVDAQVLKLLWFVALVVLIVFTIARNLPGVPFLGSGLG